MAVYTPLPGATVEAFQWLGDPLSAYALPGWAAALALHAPSDQMLHVPCWNGTFAARIGDWIVKNSTGEVNVVSNTVFAAGHNVDEVAVEETKRTAAELKAEAAEARAVAAEEKHVAAKAKVAPPPPPVKKV